MIFTPLSIEKAFVIDIELRSDDRGFFSRAWCRNEFERAGIRSRFVQANLAHSSRLGTLRGLHYQTAPHEEAKLLRCTRGAVFDVMVDLRVESPTFKQWVGIELTADNRRSVFVPEGCAHGYLTMTNDTEVLYQVSAFYSPEFERGLRWNDSAFGIEWPMMADYFISEKDQNWPSFE
jgi:dTDP-4-dehydrorhamnose 3,5-epimerase